MILKPYFHMLFLPFFNFSFYLFYLLDLPPVCPSTWNQFLGLNPACSQVAKKETKLQTNIFPHSIPQFFSFYTRRQSSLPPRPICIPAHLLGGYPSSSCPSSVHPLGSGARTIAKLSFILFSFHVFEFLVPPTKTHIIGANPSPFCSVHPLGSGEQEIISKFCNFILQYYADRLAH